VQPPTIRIRDLGSKNGTFVNGINIGGRFTESPPDDLAAEGEDACELRPGDVIALGALRLRLELEASDTSRARFVLPAPLCMAGSSSGGPTAVAAEVANPRE
jgi:pSer/pThr/pTyr-binding forkhead associated (FHA) protein